MSRPTTRSGRRPARSPEAPDQAAAIRTAFFGSGPFAIPILDALAAMPGVELAGVVAGRGTPVAEHSATLARPVLEPTSLRHPDVAREIADLDARVGVLADYGLIVPADVIDGFPAGILNVHPSLLPRWRGASPIQATIAAGDPQAGVTVIAMDAGLDTGPIVAAEAWPLAGTEDAASLRERAAVVGAALLTRKLGPWLAGAIAVSPQDGGAVTLTRRLDRDDGRLDPGRPASELERLVRALAPWPGCHLETDIGRLIVLATRVVEAGARERPGTLERVGSDLVLSTAAGDLVLDTVQPAGGRPMDGAAFLRGRGRDLPGTTVHPARTMARPWMWTP